MRTEGPRQTSDRGSCTGVKFLIFPSTLCLLSIDSTLLVGTLPFLRGRGGEKREEIPLFLFGFMTKVDLRGRTWPRGVRCGSRTFINKVSYPVSLGASCLVRTAQVCEGRTETLLINWRDSEPKGATISSLPPLCTRYLTVTPTLPCYMRSDNRSSFLNYLPYLLYC